MQYFRFLKVGEIVRKGDLHGYGLNYGNGWIETSDYGTKMNKYHVGWYCRPLKSRSRANHPTTNQVRRKAKS